MSPFGLIAFAIDARLCFSRGARNAIINEFWMAAKVWLVFQMLTRALLGGILSTRGYSHVTKKYRGSNSNDGGNTGDGVKIAGGVIGSGDEIGENTGWIILSLEFSEELKELLSDEAGKRTRRIIKTIHVDFDELTAMAFEHSSSGPALHENTPATIIRNSCQTLILQHRLYQLRELTGICCFIPLFDEFLNPSPSVDIHSTLMLLQINEVNYSILLTSTVSTFTTTVDQDAPSPSNSKTTPETKPLVIPNDVEEDNHNIEVAHIAMQEELKSSKRLEAWCSTYPGRTSYSDYFEVDLQEKTSLTGRIFEEQSSISYKDFPQSVLLLHKITWSVYQNGFEDCGYHEWVISVGERFMISSADSRSYIVSSERRQGITSGKNLILNGGRNSKLDEDKEGKVRDPTHYRGRFAPPNLTASRPDLNLESSIALTAYADADHALFVKDTRRRNFWKYSKLLGDRLVSLSSKRQKHCYILVTEAEYNCLVPTMCSNPWMRSQL
ncbi:hypothetical protein Tco_0273633 [Tanacetum coccineum]